MQVKKGTPIFFDELEKELTKRILRVQDEDLKSLIDCFSQDDSPVSEGNVSGKFMQIILKVITDKKERFQLRTLVHIIWSLAKLSFTEHNSQVLHVLKELKDYPKLVNGIETMS